MSLEAIAALLGHHDLSMTMVYARIADRTVADEYFAVTEKVEALYAARPTRDPARRRRGPVPCGPCAPRPPNGWDC
jgi:integrase